MATMTENTNHRMTSPTHYCKDCGAAWRQNDDFSMSVRSATPCPACDNTPVGGQLLPLEPGADRVERSLQSHIADIMRSWSGTNGGVFTIEACASEVARYVKAFYGALYAQDPKRIAKLTGQEYADIYAHCADWDDFARTVESMVKG